MGPIVPGNSQPLQKTSSVPQPAGVQPTTKSEQPQTKHETTHSTAQDDGSETVQRPSAEHNPIQGDPGKDAKNLEKTMNSPENLAALDKKLNDGDSNDLSQVKNQMLGEVKQSLGQDKAIQFMRKLSSTKMVPDPANPGKQIQQGKLYDRMLQSYLAEYKNAPPEKREAALQNLTHLLAGGAVKVLNDDDNC